MKIKLTSLLLLGLVLTAPSFAKDKHKKLPQAPKVYDLAGTMTWHAPTEPDFRGSYSSTDVGVISTYCSTGDSVDCTGDAPHWSVDVKFDDGSVGFTPHLYWDFDSTRKSNPDMTNPLRDLMRATPKDVSLKMTFKYRLEGRKYCVPLEQNSLLEACYDYTSYPADTFAPKPESKQ